STQRAIAPPASQKPKTKNHVILIHRHHTRRGGFTNHHRRKQTISKTRPHPTINHHLHLGIKYKYQVDVNYW
ncbi:hypothetical protein Q5687_08515, partial [Microcoleus sp. AT10_D2]|uniref:hypothetical protein n=1 Tax=Microcoleus sp. AT10_D2 TaxID=3055286 RepID=UPI002FCF9096